MWKAIRPALQPLRNESMMIHPGRLARRPLSISCTTSTETSRLRPNRLLHQSPTSGLCGNQKPFARNQSRQNATSSEARPPTDEAADEAARTPTAPASVESEGSSKMDVPSYDITFTCKPCFHRATHRISKQGYHKGTVIITCPKCSARHLMSDHLRVCSVSYAARHDFVARNCLFSNPMSC